MNYRVLITDVTCYGSLRCVAGWDLDRNTMIRPEPATAVLTHEASRFWEQDLAGQGKVFAVGNVVQFDGSDKPGANFPFPHATEDRLLSSSPKVVAQMSVAELRAEVAGAVSKTLAGAFDGGLKRFNNGKASVPVGFPGRSLGAIETLAANLTVFEDVTSSGKSQLRARLKEGDNTYNLSLTAEAYKGIWPATDVGTLRKQVFDLGTIHVRVGLARGYKDFGCLAQVNGIYGIA